MPTRRGIKFAAIGTALLVPTAIWALAGVAAGDEPKLPAQVSLAASATPVRTGVDAVKLGSASSLLSLAHSDPQALVRLAQKRYEREITDYRCLLVKRERVKGKMTDVQEIELRYRRSPQAVYLLWQKNPGGARRALHRGGDPAYTDDDGELLARVEPAGAIARLFVSDIYTPIHGKRAKAASRRTLDQCGFGASFEMLIADNALAERHGELDFRFDRVGEIDGRPTFVLVRQLPYSGDDGRYRNAKMVMHIDAEWLLPVGVETYADAAGTQLLGHYRFVQVERNPGMTEADFKF